VFNVSGPELLVILLLALVVLGPDKLPEAARKFGRVMAEVRRISNGFQAEMRDAMREPIRATQETLDLAQRQFEDTTGSGARPAGEATGTTATGATADGAPPHAGPDPVHEATSHTLDALASHGLGMVPDPAAPPPADPVEGGEDEPEASPADDPAA